MLRLLTETVLRPLSAVTIQRVSDVSAGVLRDDEHTEAAAVQPAVSQGNRAMGKLIIGFAGTLCALVWLLLLVATAFNLVAVSAGLVVGLYITGKA